MKRYLIRLDDACPTMDHAKWQRMEDILDKYGIKPMVGVIPNNEDSQLKIKNEDEGFWGKVFFHCQEVKSSKLPALLWQHFYRE